MKEGGEDHGLNGLLMLPSTTFFRCPETCCNVNDLRKEDLVPPMDNNRAKIKGAARQTGAE